MFIKRGNEQKFGEVSRGTDRPDRLISSARDAVDSVVEVGSCSDGTAQALQGWYSANLPTE